MHKGLPCHALFPMDKQQLACSNQPHSVDLGLYCSRARTARTTLCCSKMHTCPVASAGPCGSCSGDSQGQMAARVNTAGQTAPLASITLSLFSRADSRRIAPQISELHIYGRRGGEGITMLKPPPVVYPNVFTPFLKSVWHVCPISKSKRFTFFQSWFKAHLLQRLPVAQQFSACFQDDEFLEKRRAVRLIFFMIRIHQSQRKK